MSRVRAYLQLVRLPNIFTALADIFAGYWLVSESLNISPRLAGLLICSACLYAAGIVMNDLADIHIDRTERPDRPLPSGRVSPAAARTLAATLCAAGLAAAALAGRRGDGIAAVFQSDNYSLWIAVALLAGIVVYNWLAKTTVLGPAVMGLCRGLNLLLGASLLADVNEANVRPILFLAGTFALYVASLTWFGRDEAGEIRPRRLITGLAGILIAVVVMGTVAAAMSQFASFTLVLWLALLIHLARIGWRTIRIPAPLLVQHAMKTLIFGIIVFDAVIAAAAQGWQAGLCVLALLVPTILTGRWIYST